MDKKRIAISGSSGFIGRVLAERFRKDGHEVWALVRRPAVPGAREIGWRPEVRSIESGKLEGFDAVVHLAGESIASGRWTPQRKAAIRRSRVEGTRFLSQSLAGLGKPPKTLIAASAIGFYGDRGNEELTEKSPRGGGFLPEVCDEWEAAASPAREAGIRVAHLRTGIVLNPGGGALGKMLPPFSLGLGGVIGAGDQWMSWIAREDLVRAYELLIFREDLSGPFNGTAPGAVTNRDFTKLLGKALGRPTPFPLPSFAVKLLLGEMGERLLLEGQKVGPERLAEAGFEFLYPGLEEALRFELGESP